MVKVKICGITDKAETVFLNKYLPDYAGFVFAESKRQITPSHAANLAAELSSAIKKAGVFANMEPGRVIETVEKAELDVVQLHGREDGEYIACLRSLLNPAVEIWKALWVRSGGMSVGSHICSYNADKLLLDTYSADSLGGTGKCFDWSVVRHLGITLPIVLAGGLSPDNVRQAIEQASPYAVDASSGVESGGLKDERKVREFIRAVRNTIFILFTFIMLLHRFVNVMIIGV